MWDETASAGDPFKYSGTAVGLVENLRGMRVVI